MARWNDSNATQIFLCYKYFPAANKILNSKIKKMARLLITFLSK